MLKTKPLPMSAPSRPRRTCDIVMKGGITSGVPYPQAITTLADLETTRDTLEALRDIRGLRDGTQPSTNAPRPRPVLRPRPQI